MSKRRFQRAVLFTGIIGLLCVGGYGFWLFQAQRHQDALNRQLIAALAKQDTSQALLLVKEGADPNTPYAPSAAPSLRQTWNDLLHRSALPTNESPTAFQIACGDLPLEWVFTQQGENRLDTPQLVEVMIQHGAMSNTKDMFGRNAVHWAANCDHLKTVAVLLEHKVDPNVRSIYGDTPLIDAMQGSTSLDTVRLLLKHGADPNLSDENGHTPLRIAQETGHTEMIAVLRQYGAKK